MFKIGIAASRRDLGQFSKVIAALQSPNDSHHVRTKLVSLSVLLDWKSTLKGRDEGARSKSALGRTDLIRLSR
jgi:hypothetical protein